MKKLILGTIIAAAAIIVTAFNIDNTPVYWSFLSIAGCGAYLVYKGNEELDKQQHYLTYEEAKKLGMFDDK